jgi:DNA modification methylase
MDNTPAVRALPVADLIPYARNSRTHDEGQIAQLAASLDEFGMVGSIVVRDGVIAKGHGTLDAIRKLYAAGKLLYPAPGKAGGADPYPVGTAPVLEVSGWTDAQFRAYVIADNKLALNAGWDEEMLRIEFDALKDDGFDLSLVGFDADELKDIFTGPATGEGEGEGKGGEPDEGEKVGSLAERFLIPPFTVLNAREGWWQDRKRAWLALGIKSELGRGENALGMSEQAKNPDTYRERREQTEDLRGGLTHRTTTDPYRNKKKGEMGGVLMKSWTSHPLFYPQKQAKEKELGRELTTAEFIEKYFVPPTDDAYTSGTSIFDPVLCELAYAWFSPKGGTVLDPFAGGSVRGVVASKLGRQYIGHELRAEQVEANRKQGAEICADAEHPPAWICGDSRTIDKTCKDVHADLVFTCPPYADLEVYSDNPADLSTLGYEEFRAAYFEIIKKACARLKKDRFACCVVGEVRDKKGNYYDFVGDTVQAFRDAGLHFYNEAILVTAIGSLPIRTGKQFATSRKLGKTHQNILVFVKGDGKKAAAACGEVDVSAAISAVEAEGGEGAEAL